VIALVDDPFEFVSGSGNHVIEPGGLISFCSLVYQINPLIIFAAHGTNKKFLRHSPY
jgi:hypothetical protein